MTEQASDYERAWKFLYAQSPPKLQQLVQQAKDNDTVAPKEVTAFIKRVIAMAEAGS
jgi:hypothetical protein